MFAIVDIETTGGSPRKNRITEIAIFIHNGKRVIEQYCTLINPETYISPFITALTGISNEMVQEAPTFAEVADKIAELTKDKIFVGHNVRFDYTFVCNEFKRLGKRYQRRNLCTVRLSRSILPGLQSYSLGRLCAQMGIPVEHRHRAFGDAAATAELFNELLHRDKQYLLKDALKDEIRQSIVPPNLTRADIDALPDETGVYYFRDAHGRNMYIGKSTNIRQRIISHLSEDMNSERHQEMRQKLHSIHYELTGNELCALLLESSEIRRYMPPYNRALRRKRKGRYGLYMVMDEDSYLKLEVALIRLEGEPLHTSASRRNSENNLLRIMAKYGLCAKKCGLHQAVTNCEEGLCPRCAAEEKPESYNQRVHAAIGAYTFEQSDFAIVTEGRSPNELAVVCVSEGKYHGYGYFEEDVPGMNFNQIKELIPAGYPHPDLHNIIRSHLNKGKKSLKVIYPEG